MRLHVSTTDSVYVFNRDQTSVVRYPIKGRMSRHKVFIPIPVVRIERLVLGEGMVLILDLLRNGEHTVRTTAPVVSAHTSLREEP